MQVVLTDWQGSIYLGFSVGRGGWTDVWMEHKVLALLPSKQSAGFYDNIVMASY